MLLHHYDESMGGVYFQTVKKKNEDRQIWNIRQVIGRTDQAVLENILFLHAWEWMQYDFRNIRVR